LTPRKHICSENYCTNGLLLLHHINDVEDSPRPVCHSQSISIETTPRRERIHSIRNLKKPRIIVFKVFKGNKNDDFDLNVLADPQKHSEFTFAKTTIEHLDSKAAKAKECGPERPRAREGRGGEEEEGAWTINY
jgi:hypothetical protein